MLIKELFAVLFPHLVGVCVEQVFRSGTMVRIRARTGTVEAACPACGTSSQRVHSHYERRLSDSAVGGQEVLIHLRVHRFLCCASTCAKATFAEQIPGLTVRYGRRSIRAVRALQAIALALGGRAGARLAGRLAASVSRMTLIRLIRALPDPALESGPRVLGVDDFALRRGHSYGTILIDISTSTVVDVLADRTADTLAAWLRTHPGVEIVCRDRAGAYAEGIARGAPHAMQVADRFHLWRNLGEAVERTVTRHRDHLHDLTTALSTRTETSPPAAPPAPSPSPADRQDRTATRTRERHAAVHALLEKGQGLREIARLLSLGRNTVRRFARAASPEDLLVHDGTGRRPKNLEAYDSYLRKRWAEGYTNAELLYQQLRARGYHGSGTTVRQYARPWRDGTPPALTPARPPTVRQATGWFLRNPARLNPDEHRQLQELATTCPQLAALREHVRQFAEMMMHRHGQNLETWMDAVLGDDLPELHSFVTGLRRDQDHCGAIRAVHLARSGAVKARTACVNELRSLLITAPAQLREQMTGLSAEMLATTCARLRPAADIADPLQGTKLSLRGLARRYQALTSEIEDLDVHLKALVRQARPDLLGVHGVGPETAAQLLITCGDNPDRLTSPATFAALCGAAPIPASSGKTVRYRLSRGGDRQANRALYLIALARMAWCPRTRAYVTRRPTEGKSKKEIIRCLKRYIARELFKVHQAEDNEQRSPSTHLATIGASGRFRERHLPRDD
ncbi:ISL3 family transposase, partial [Nonomuraea sp. KM90]|uniref:ISL3 family transposase n=1 Tax=Nonomuraea sp. KM90 TaxID=3457428 RepID=UPI003FCC6A7B